jgi:hypothetical protein
MTDAAQPPLAHLGLRGDGDEIFMLGAVEQAFEIKLGDHTRQLETVGELHNIISDRLAAKGAPTDDIWPRLCKVIAHETGAPAGRIAATTAFVDHTPPPSRVKVLIQAVVYLTALGALAALFSWLGRV